MSEIVRVRKDEWEAFRRELELLVQRHEELLRENVGLKEKLRAASERLTLTDQKAAAELEKIRANISRVLQQTEKEIKS